MCGIMGYLGPRPVVDVLLRGLKQLEYRGYDSAGLAFWKGGRFEITKSEGKIGNVERLLAGQRSHIGGVGLGHTRWATHGRPTTQNAHPHKTGPVVLVHNGIIENYQSIRERVVQQGHAPQSETDSELFGFLVCEELKKVPNFVEAVRRAFLQLEGACSVVVASETEPDLFVGVRNGSPLVAARAADGGVILASDAQPILEYSRDVVFLESGDVVVASKKGLEFLNLETGRPLERKFVTLDWSPEKLDKRGFPHYMLKEIHDQPQSLIDTLNGVLDRVRTDPFPLATQPGIEILDRIDELTLSACGTSSHAALLGKYWLERWAGIATDVELASEYRYRDPVLRRNSAVIGITQSGETADTLAVIREMRRRRVPTLAITNVRGSTISREADATFFLHAGPEIGVAATKTFTAQALMLLLWSGYLGLRRGKDTSTKIPALFDQLLKVPHLVERQLQSDFPERVKKVAGQLKSAKGFFFIGRGYSYPIALEGALKLKEIAYVHAEGYAGGELKHGPIAMIDRGFVVVVIAPRDSWYEKTVSNLQEVKARGATIVGIGFEGDTILSKQCDFWIEVPVVGEELTPFVTSPAVQLLSYELAVLHGTEVDQPRNLAKSVTVE